MDHDGQIAELTKSGVPPTLLADFPTLPSDIRGLLLYGSQARGDATTNSDVDLLALVDAPRATLSSGAISVSFYTSYQLHTGIGTLFGAHLKRDAKIVFDRGGQLAAAISDMGAVDVPRLMLRVQKLSALFANLDRDLPKYLVGLLRQARYLLRSTLYAQAIAEGQPCFSINALAVRLDDPKLVELLTSRPRDRESAPDLYDCLSRLSVLIGEIPNNPNGSLEATIVNEWETPSDLLSMAFMALGLTGQGFDYAEVEKILL